MSKQIGISGLSTFDDKFGGIYRGTVVDNEDPLKLGRVKVRVYPMFADVDIEVIPWAISCNPLFAGAGDGFGWFAIPAINSNVYCMFEQGSPYQPILIGEASDAIKGQPTDRITNYPNRKVLRSSSGIEIYIDDTLKRARIVHPTGEYIEIDGSGVTISSPAVFVYGNVNIDTGATGVFSTTDSKQVSVANGIVTDIT